MESNTPDMHKKTAPSSARFALITVSTSRYGKFGAVSGPEQADDVSGAVMADLLTDAGLEVAAYSLLPDSESHITASVRELAGSDIDVIIISGGTGLASRDVTLEAVEPLYGKSIPGFGELFRQKSVKDVGTAAMLSRASAGIVGDCVVFCLPGSPGAVELAMRELIIHEAGHILKHIIE